MDTDMLFKDNRGFTNGFNNVPSSMTTDSVDSSSSFETVEGDAYPTNMCWNFDSGFDNDFDSMLNRNNLEPLEDFHNIVNCWGNTVKQESIDIDEKPILLKLEEIEEDAVELKCIVKKDPNSSKIDTHSDVEQKKKDLPDLDEIVSTSLLDCTDFPAIDFSSNLVNDLPPNLDLCAFINGEEPELPNEIIEAKPSLTDLTIVKEETHPTEQTEKIIQRQPELRAGRKKIDLKAKKYIVDDEEEENIDVETISENGNSPVLEARDLDSLLEQFEATEVKDLPCTKEVKDSEDHSQKFNSKSTVNPKVSQTKQINKKLKQHKNIKKTSSSEQKVKIEQHRYVTNSIKETKHKAINTNSLSSISTLSNNKQIIEAPSQDLIDRIKGSGKRKPVKIIDPVPNIPFKKKKIHDNPVKSLSGKPIETSVATQNDTASILRFVAHDHNYCSIGTSQKEQLRFDKARIPTIKEEIKVKIEEVQDGNVEVDKMQDKEVEDVQSKPLMHVFGTFMVSLLQLKNIEPKVEKKKLNIEEYKKRRLGVLKTRDSSNSSSQTNENSSSPLPENENIKRLKHEEKLKKMAMELLNTPPKSSVLNVKPTLVQDPVVPVRNKVVVPSPSDMVKIVYVSVGVNTEISGRNPLIPVEKLEEIKPLLQNANVKINSNSLITSMIENIPKIIKPDKSVITTKAVSEVHGENKTIIFLPKDRKPPRTSSVGIQTSISLLGNNKRRYRRRNDSESSDSSSSITEVKRKTRRSKYSSHSNSSRSSSSSSNSSSSSRYSSGSRSDSISRSPSPRKHRKPSSFNDEYIREVEERRVVYVGKIASKTTKKDLHKRFSRFGPIKNISLHFRDHGDNYGFVTFEKTNDAYDAIEHGNDGSHDIKYDLSFGGRRLFCKTEYADLDNMREDYVYGTSRAKKDDSFEKLLQDMKDKLKRRKL